MDWRFWKLTAFWLLFMVGHSALANEQVKEFFRIRLGQRFKYYRLVYSFIALLSLATVLVFQSSLPSLYLFIPSLTTSIFGIVFGLCGGILMAHCIRKYFLNLSGIRLSSDKNAKLETAGIHIYIRHPLYLGTLIFIWSIFLIWPISSNLLSTTAITSYTIIGINLEEKKLLKAFGKSYMLYSQRTPKLIPKFFQKQKAAGIHQPEGVSTG